VKHSASKGYSLLTFSISAFLFLLYVDKCRIVHKNDRILHLSKPLPGFELLENVSLTNGSAIHLKSTNASLTSLKQKNTTSGRCLLYLSKFYSKKKGQGISFNPAPFNQASLRFFL